MKRITIFGLVALFVAMMTLSIGAAGGTPDPNNQLIVTPGVTVIPSATVTLAPPTQTPLPAIPDGALTGTVIRARVLLVRDNPFIGAPVVGRILRGQTYAIVGRDDDARWFLLQLSERQAWAWGYYLYINGNEFNAPVVSSFITTGNPATYTGVVGQASNGLRLRAAPTTESEQIGRITVGDIMPIIAVNSNRTWYKVIYKDTPGWVAADWMRIVEGDLNALPVE